MTNTMSGNAWFSLPFRVIQFLTTLEDCAERALNSVAGRGFRRSEIDQHGEEDAEPRAEVAPGAEEADLDAEHGAARVAQGAAQFFLFSHPPVVQTDDSHPVALRGPPQRAQPPAGGAVQLQH